ncbi:MAG: GNAT family N-acetyltransferase [Candidatus Hydrogenedentes bacterium]|nr:GNAT family N-acetyltransferase [Candidatus Hydrogenedentota bacterium]
MDKLVYKDAEVADIDQILQLWRRFWEPQAYERNLEAKITDEPDLVIIAESGGHIVGTVIGGFDGWWAWVYRLAVQPKFQRKGVATHLIEIIHQRLASRGADAVGGIVSPSKESVRGFLSANGYACRPYEVWSKAFHEEEA